MIYWCLQVFLSIEGCTYPNLSFSHIIGCFGMLGLLHRVGKWTVTILGALFNISTIKELTEFGSLENWTSLYFLYIWSRIFRFTGIPDIDLSFSILMPAILLFLFRCIYVECFRQWKREKSISCKYILLITLMFNVCIYILFLFDSPADQFVFMRILRDILLLLPSIFNWYVKRLRQQMSVISFMINVGFLLYTIYFCYTAPTLTTLNVPEYILPSYAMRLTALSFFVPNSFGFLTFGIRMFTVSLVIALSFSYSVSAILLVASAKPLLMFCPNLCQHVTPSGSISCALCKKTTWSGSQPLTCTCGHILHTECYEQWYTTIFFCPQQFAI